MVIGNLREYELIPAIKKDDKMQLSNMKIEDPDVMVAC
jgi:hypothetical protein